MLFKRKIDRMINVEEQEEKFRKTLEKEPLEKGDLRAMIIAGLIVFVPVVIVVVLVMIGISYFFMVR